MDLEVLDKTLLAEVKQLSETKFEFEKKLLFLEREIELLEAKKQELLNQSKDTESYTKRIKSDFDYYLEEKNTAIKQVEKLQEKAQELKQIRNKTLGDLMEDIEKLKEDKNNLELEKQRVIQSKESFVKNLGEKENNLKLQEVELGKSRTDLKIKLQALDTQFSAVNEAKQNAFVKMEETENIKKEAEIYLVKIQKDKDTSADLVKTAEERLMATNQSAIYYQNQIADLRQKEAELQQTEEALVKTKDYLKEEESKIEKERQHLSSQQSTLYNAFQEARRKNLL